MTHQPRQLIPEFQKRRNVLGEKFLIALYRLTSTVKIYQSNNEILRDCAKEFMDIIAQWVAEEGYLTIRSSRGQFFLYEEKLIYQRENFNVIKEMLDYFEQRLIPGFRFSNAINDTSIEDSGSLVREKADNNWLLRRRPQRISFTFQFGFGRLSPTIKIKTVRIGPHDQ